MNGAMSLTTTLRKLKVDAVFGYPGGAIMPVYDALPNQLRHILCRHEQGAAFAAQGYAKATGRPGVCLATSGPGATNLVTGIADAWMDSIPLLAITGQVPQELIGTNAFQEINFIEMTQGIVKASFQIEDADEVASVVEHAYQLCQSGRPGPVLIDFPKNLQLAEVTGRKEKLPTIPPVPEINATDIDQATHLICKAKKIMLMAGGGVKAAGAAQQLKILASKLNCEIVTTLNGVGLLGANHPKCMGMLGMHGSEQANDAVQACDLLIGLGVRFDDRATGRVDAFAPNAKIIHVDIDAAELGKNVATDLAIHGDVARFIDRLIEQLEHTPTLIPSQSSPPESTIHRQQIHIDVTHLLASLKGQLNQQTYVSVDVGQHQMWTAQEVPFLHANQFLTSGGLGTMGFGLPAAIGAQIAHPDATVINITGDGSFMMNLQELATAKRYQLPIKILLINNSHLGLVRQQQELFYGERYSEVDLSDNPDFCALAEVFGFHCQSISEQREVSDALDWFGHHSGPALLEVQVPHEQNVWPFVVPGEGNDVRVCRPEDEVGIGERCFA